jgi:uncharacterized protein (DUF58 family)
MALRELTFPLVPRRRLVGLAFGAMHSARRGTGSDVAGSRPYVPGDDVDAIDWAASARLSSARDSDAFIVRERFADEAPRVVVVCDRRPEMALCPPELPWLRKAEAMRAVVELIFESTAKARGFVGYLDLADGEEEPFWRPPGSHAETRDRPGFAAPPDGVACSLDFLAGHRRSVPAGSFVFVLSDFLSPPPRAAWARAVELRWDVVPVVIQDPVWEQSFPEVDGIVVPLADAGGRVRLVRLRREEAQERRLANEERLRVLLADFRALGIEPILISRSGPEDVFQALLGWADERRFLRGHLS